MKTFWIIVGILAAGFVLLFTAAAMKNNGDISREEERKEYEQWVMEHEKH